ncbi:MAG: MBOAT family protein [Crocinitomicaceae bacterium]|nr:MBOAT family protein [Crocinitomicaceae bacterium]
MSWEVSLIILILISTVIDYLVSNGIARQESHRKKKWLLAVSVLSNLTILGVFKYADFFIENINQVILAAGGTSKIHLLRLILPMGISFYTFQTMSYTIDVYKGKLKPEKHLGIFALYVCYFPQLVAGPIERAGNLLGELRKKVSFSYENLSWGFRLMIWGFFKKVVIADRLGIYVDQIYNNPSGYDGLALILGSALFAIQIYCDFSGYSDIAIGVSRMFGIKLRINFKLPYTALSFSEFWTRWHISLSQWFRDYLYIPLGGNRASKPRWLLNLLIVFLVSGFWHGAAWTFIIWGGLHGLYLIVENLLPKREASNNILLKGVKMLFVFILVDFAWIFFRANSLSDAFHIIENLGNWQLANFSETINGFGLLTFLLMMVILLIFVIIDPIMDRILKENTPLSLWQNQLIYSTLTAAILIFGFFGEVQFLYFQF